MLIAYYARKKLQEVAPGFEDEEDLPEETVEIPTVGNAGNSSPSSPAPKETAEALALREAGRQYVLNMIAAEASPNPAVVAKESNSAPSPLAESNTSV